MTQRYAQLAIPLALLLAPLGARNVAAQQAEPYSLDQLARMIESGVFSDRRMLVLVGENCLGFVLDAEARQRLSRAGASANLLTGLAEACVDLPPPVQTVVVSPNTLDLRIGASMTVTARALAADSTEVERVELLWASADTAIVTVTPAGVISGVAVGETTVTVGPEGGPRASVSVRVSDPVAADSLTAARRRGGKSVATAAALGVVLPGGGEFYAGNRTKGIIVVAGAAAALAAGYLIKTEDPIGDPVFVVPEGSTCTPSSCDVSRVQEIEETRQLIIGAAVAGAFWVYGLVDGILAAKRTQRAPSSGEMTRRGMTIQVVPGDGIRVAGDGGLDMTLVRVRP